MATYASILSVTVRDKLLTHNTSSVIAAMLPCRGVVRPDLCIKFPGGAANSVRSLRDRFHYLGAAETSSQ